MIPEPARDAYANEFTKIAGAGSTAAAAILGSILAASTAHGLQSGSHQTDRVLGALHAMKPEEIKRRAKKRAIITGAVAGGGALAGGVAGAGIGRYLGNVLGEAAQAPLASAKKGLLRGMRTHAEMVADAIANKAGKGPSPVLPR